MSTVVESILEVLLSCNCKFMFLISWVAVEDKLDFNFNCAEPCPNHIELLSDRKKLDRIVTAVQKNLEKEPGHYLVSLYEYYLPRTVEELLGYRAEQKTHVSNTFDVADAVQKGEQCTYLLCPRCYRWIRNELWRITALVERKLSEKIAASGIVSVVKQDETYEYIEWRHDRCHFVWPSNSVEDFYSVVIRGQGDYELIRPEDDSGYDNIALEREALSQLRDELRKYGFWLDLSGVL